MWPFRKPRNGIEDVKKDTDRRLSRAIEAREEARDIATHTTPIADRSSELLRHNRIAAAIIGIVPLSHYNSESGGHGK